MTLYQPLGDYLARLTTDHVNLTFEGIERIIGRRLPPSARTRTVWWANDHSSPQRCCAAWLNAGWKVDSVDLGREMVSFARVGRPKVGASSAAPSPAVSGLQVKSISVPPSQSDATGEWHWEGNIQAALIRHLVAEGWSIRRAADTAGHEHGTDVLAARDGRLLAVEVKGYPPSIYTFGARQGELKPPPKAREQAEKFLAQALHAALRTKTRRPNAEVALAFPSLYEAMVEEIGWALGRLDVTVYLVSEDGAVRLACGR